MATETENIKSSTAVTPPVAVTSTAAKTTAKAPTGSDWEKFYDDIHTDVNDAEAEGKKIISFGLSHLVLIILLFIVTIGAFYEYDSRRADRASDIAKAASVAAQNIAESNKAFQALTAKQVSQLADQNKSLQNTISQLASSLTSQNVALAQKTQAVSSLPPSALSAQWGSAASEPAPVLDANGNFVTPLPLAQKSYVALVTVPALQSDEKNLQQQVTAESQLASNNEKQFDAEVSAHQKDNSACKAEETDLNDQLKKAKAEARKDKIKRFVEGALFGAVAVAVKFL